MAVLEAMAVGTPVVGGAQSGGIPYMIDHGRTGLLCDVADPARIAGAMATLLDDEPLRRQLGAAAQKHVFQHYSASVVVDRYLDAYERVLAGRPLASEVTICSQSAA